MVKHIVLWKIRDDDQKQQNIDKMIDMLTSLVGKIEGLVSMEMGYNFNTASEYDVVLYSTFKNAAALKYYQNHPEHLKCKDFVRSVSVGRTCADYFYEEGVESSRPFDEVPDAPVITEEPTPAPSFEPAAPAPSFEPAAPAPSFKSAAPVDPVIPDPVPVAPPPPPPPPAPKKEERSTFFSRNKHNNEPEPVTMEERGNTWTCPKCGKVMPKYVGTCGCGEPQPFSLDDVPPVFQGDPHAGAIPATTGSTDSKPKPAPKPAPAPVQKEEKTGLFGSKKKEEVKPVTMGERGNTWTCPKCGKVMPKYVGTCGCGEPQPFSFDDVPPVFQGDPHAGAIPTTTGSAENRPSSAAPAAPKEELPTGFRSRKRNTPPKTEFPAIEKDEHSEEDERIIDATQFNDAAPSLQSYSPQTTPPTDNTPDPELDYIKNDNDAGMPFGSPDTGDNFSGYNFDDAPPPAPMRFDDAPPPAPMRFDDVPPPAPMRFDDAPPPAPMRFDDAPPPAPMRFDDAPPPAPMRFDSTPNQVQTSAPKTEKKHLFGKKAKEEEAIRKAEAVVNSRRDIPDNGSTWTCPKCGKIMPKYVGTCGCGEPQPFEF